MVAWTPDGRLITEQIEGDDLQLISLDPSSGESHPVTFEGPLNFGADVSPDGRRLAFISNRTGMMKIWTSDITGNNPRRLTDEDGEEILPHFAPDGEWIVYIALIGDEWFMRKASSSGGTPVALTDDTAFLARVSPDGKQIACLGLDATNDRYRLAVVPFDGGPLRFLPVKDEFQLHCWMPAGDELACSLREEGVDNLWAVPLDGSPPRKLTRFEKGRILSADWNAAGDSVAVLRRETSSDVVLIRNFRP
jgi:TolB protein